jgi:hypothetical protein
MLRKVTIGVLAISWSNKMSIVKEATFHHLRIREDDLYWLPCDTNKLCALPYPNHKSGCPKTGWCPYLIDDLKPRIKGKKLYLAWVEFDLVAYTNEMKKKHPHWTKRQLHNVLYYQGTLRHKLRINIWRIYGKKIGAAGLDYDIIMNAEGGGINYYLTMRKLGIKLDMMTNLNTIRIIALIIDNATAKPVDLDYYL